jgi:hypothetical protein
MYLNKKSEVKSLIDSFSPRSETGVIGQLNQILDKLVVILIDSYKPHIIRLNS